MGNLHANRPALIGETPLASSLILQGDNNVLKCVTAKTFIRIFSKAQPIDQFGVDLYFKLLEKITVYDAVIPVVSLLNESELLEKTH
jgi:hypothetical protein